MKQGRLGYNSSNGRYGLLSSDLWIDTGFHCGEGLEVLVDDKWVQTRMEMNPAREWYLAGTPYCGNLEYVQAKDTGVNSPAGRKGTFDGRYGCRKCFCVTFDKSNKTAVSGENFL